MIPPDNNLQAELLFEIKAQLGEGAFWDSEREELLWIDIESKNLYIYNPKNKKNDTFEMPSRIGTVVPHSSGQIAVALEDGIHFLDRTTKKLNEFSIINKNSALRFNDGKCDPSGRLWVGTMDLECKKPIGSLYMILPDGTFEEKLDGVTISNGIIWNKQKTKMFYIDTKTQAVRVFDYDNTNGKISNGKILAKIEEETGSPDGMCIDENDNLWVALWNGNAVICIDHITGKIINTIKVPAHNVTSCAFGGTDRDVLYITTASVDMTTEEKEKSPLAGSLFWVKPGVRGPVSVHFGQ